MQIHVTRDGQQFGPYSVEQVRELLGRGSLLTTDWVWYDGLPEWVQILQIEDFSADSAQPAAVEPVPTGEIQVPETEVDAPAQVYQPVAAIKGGINAAAIAARAQRLSKGQKSTPRSGRSASAQQAAPIEAGKAGETSAISGRALRVGVVVLLMGVIGVLVAMNLPKAKPKLVQLYVPKSTTDDVIEKLLKLEGAHLTRDANNEISGVTLTGVAVSSNGLKSLGELKNLRRLTLVNCSIGDDGLANLKGLTRLTLLDVSDNPITDKSVDVLKGLTALADLNLANTKISAGGAVDIKKALSACNIRRGGAVPVGK